MGCLTHKGSAWVLACLLATACGSHGSTGVPTDDAVTVHTDTELSKDPRIFAAGTTAYHWATAWGSAAADSAEMRHHYLDDSQPGLVLLEVSWPDSTSTTPPDTATVNDFMETTYQAAMTDILDAGGQILLQVSGPPRWASSDPDNTSPISSNNASPVWSRVPPDTSADYATWQSAFTQLGTVVKTTFPDAVRSGCIRIAYAAELDNEEFYGDLSAYAPALDAAVRALRQVDPAILVGGGGRLEPWSYKTAPAQYEDLTRPVLDGWLSDCQAIGCQVDFIVGHKFTLLPVAWGVPTDPRGVGTSYDDIADSVRSVTDSYGYGDAGLVLTDQTTWEFHDSLENSWFSSDHDTEYKAAYIPASLMAMSDAGFDSHTIGTLFEQLGGKSEFVGDWGLFTVHGLMKPAFHGAAMASTLSKSDALLGVDPPDSPFVFVAAGHTGDDIRVLVSRFVPDTDFGHQMLQAAFGTRYLADGNDITQFEADFGESDYGTAVEDLKDVLNSHDDSDYNSSLRPETLALLQAWYALDDAAETAPATISLSIHLEDLAQAHYDVVVHQVSATVSNAYDWCVRQGQDCTDVSAVNAGAAALAVVSDPDASLDQSDPVLTIELGRRQVDLVDLTPR